MLFGVSDIVSLLFIVSVNTAMCLLGDMFERINRLKVGGKLDWSAYFYSTIAALYSWTVIGA